MPDEEKPKSRLEKLQEQQKQIAAQIKDLASREKAQSRKNDTRRKIVAGALALEHLEKNRNSDFGQKLYSLIDEYAKPHERSLFEYLGIKPAVPANDQKEKSLKKDFPK